MDRTELQNLAARVISKVKRLLCQWPTGMGKTRVALNFIRDNPDMKCLILVPEQNNISNWEEEFNVFGAPLENVTIACYASLHKYENTYWDFLVLDEVPHIDTELKSSFCKSINSEYILALGAKVDDEEKTTLEEVYGKFYISRWTLKMAIQYGFLPIPEVNILHLQLDDTTPKYIYPNFHQKLTAKQKYAALKADIDTAVQNYSGKASKDNEKKMFILGLKRKKFLGLCKDNAAKQLCSKLTKDKVRFICFCSSIKQAEMLGKDHSFTSKSDKHMKHLERFNKHEIDSLFVVAKCIEGQNLRDIEAGVIVQLGNTARITIQEIGRVLRSKNPVVYILVFDDTKDMNFLDTVTDNIPEEYIKHNNYKIEI